MGGKFRPTSVVIAAKLLGSAEPVCASLRSFFLRGPWHMCVAHVWERPFALLQKEVGADDTVEFRFYAADSKPYKMMEAGNRETK